MSAAAVGICLLKERGYGLICSTSTRATRAVAPAPEMGSQGGLHFGEALDQSDHVGCDGGLVEGRQDDPVM